MVESYSPSRTKTSSRGGGRLWSLLISVVILASLVLGVIFRYAIIDQLTYWQYKPTAEVMAIATNATLTDKGTFYFYASRPEVDNADAFNTHCQRKEEHSAILGCYDGRQIFIYNVTDARLAGIKEVTAAHEMLHAVWERLSETERVRLATLLEVEVKKHTTVELQDRLSYYERTQPGERANELHSIIGTEVSDISPELEAHYRMYFSDRQAVVAKHNAYSKVFKDLEVQANKLLAEIEALQAEIEADKQQYEAAKSALEQENAALEQEYAAMDRTNSDEVDAYNARASAYNAQLGTVRAQYVSITERIAIHNDKVVEYNQITGSRQQLQDSIDSLKAPQQ